MGYYKRMEERARTARRLVASRYNQKRFPVFVGDATRESSHAILQDMFPEDFILSEVLVMPVDPSVFGAVGAASSDIAMEDEEFRRSYPVLAALLFDATTTSGSRRQTATLTIVCEDMVVKAGLRDRQMNASLWVSSKTVGGVFGVLEEALMQRPVAWRRNAVEGSYRRATKSS